MLRNITSGLRSLFRNSASAKSWTKSFCIVKLVMQESGTLLLVGLAIGTVIALKGGQAARAMLFGLRPGDPLTLGTALFSLSFVAALSSLLPAQRAARHDPMIALRNE
jgi:ABC-type antimicrobial peptide transport system permease subunit